MLPPQLREGVLTASPYLLPAISNGDPEEQALIRRHWKESFQAAGTIVWEYCLGSLYVDAICFPGSDSPGTEAPGRNAPAKYPLLGAQVILLEAKATLTPELIGQALVYRELVLAKGATVTGTLIFANSDPSGIASIARQLGLIPIISPLLPEPAA